MVKIYQTDRGPVRVESMGEAFFLCTRQTENGHEWELYVAAVFADEAVKKAIIFWYGKAPKYINK